MTEKGTTLECHDCIQQVETSDGRLVQIDYRFLKHKPEIDRALSGDSENGSWGMIADAGAVGERLDKLDTESENYNKWLHDIYIALYNNQLSDDLDDSTAELGDNKQSNIGKRVKYLEENKLDKSVIGLYEKKEDHKKDIDTVKSLIPDNLIQIISNNGLTISTNIMNDIRSIQDRLALTSDGVQLITDWNTAIKPGAYYSEYDSTTNGPITNDNIYGDITSLYFGNVSLVQHNYFNYVYQTVYRYFYKNSKNNAPTVAIWRRSGEINNRTSDIKWNSWNDMSPVDSLTEYQLNIMMERVELGDL